MSFRAHVGLGANLGGPAARLRWALDRLAELAEVEARSALYRSAPMGPQDQPDFCNAVCILRTKLGPAALMRALLNIETATGRVRQQKWGARTLDLDLLHVDGIAMQSADLCLPHPGIGLRNFVLVPWAEIAPTLIVPGLGCIGELAAAAGREGLRAWNESD